jgi:hypothetical protein
MKIKHLSLFLFLVLFFSNANAQEFKLGKVSIAELEQKAHPKDTAAVAAILFKTGEVRFEFDQGKGFEMITRVKTRIKIYKKTGYDWANVAIQYYLGSNGKENVAFSEANTFNLVGGKIEKTKLKNEGQFDEKINKFWGSRKIVMSNVKEGSVVEYEYTIRSFRFSELKEWFFQTSVPVNYSEFITFLPEYYVYKPNFKGYIVPKIAIVDNQKYFTMNNKERSGGGFKAAKTSFSEDKIEYIETKTSYLTENLPAMKEESFVNNINNYTTSVSHELTMVKYPNSPIEMYSENWMSVAKKIYDNVDFGIELNKTGYFDDDISLLIKGITTQEEKITALFNFVKAKIKWNNYTGYSCNDGVKFAYKENTGNVAEINLMLTAMLRFSGLKANPVLVSTRSNGIAVFPNRGAFNYVIAAVETPEGLILLDATSKFSAPNVLPFRDLNWIGRLIREDGTSEEVDLMPKTASVDNVFMNYTIDVTGKVTGKVRRTRTGHNAMSFRNEIENIKEEDYLEKLENESKNIEIADYSRTNEKDVQLPVTETCSFTGTNLCELIGEKMYINPLLFFTKAQNPFKQEDREYPVDYGFPFLDKYSINIDIPEGYVVETLPKSSQINMEDDLGIFKFMSNTSGSQIQISVSHQVNSPIVSSEYYSMLKDYYQGMIAKETEKIVLKKV